MRNIEILKEILKLAESESDSPTLEVIREMIVKQRPNLLTEQVALNKDQLKLEGIE